MKIDPPSVTLEDKYGGDVQFVLDRPDDVRVLFKPDVGGSEADALLNPDEAIEALARLKKEAHGA